MFFLVPCDLTRTTDSSLNESMFETPTRNPIFPRNLESTLGEPMAETPTGETTYHPNMESSLSESMGKTPNMDDALPPFTPGTSADPATLASPYSAGSGFSMESVDPFQSLIRRRTSGSTLYTRGPIQPLRDQLTARLLQHYIDNLASWV